MEREGYRVSSCCNKNVCPFVFLTLRIIFLSPIFVVISVERKRREFILFVVVPGSWYRQNHRLYAWTRPFLEVETETCLLAAWYNYSCVCILVTCAHYEGIEIQGFECIAANASTQHRYVRDKCRMVCFQVLAPNEKKLC